jgi:hypothetical protein
MALNPYLEAGAAVLDRLATQYGLRMFLTDGQPYFTDDEKLFTDRYLRRLEVSSAWDKRHAGADINNEDLQKRMSKLTIAFALKQVASRQDVSVDYSQAVATIMKSWLFDLDPMSWIEISKLLHAEDSSQFKDSDSRSSAGSSMARSREALYVASLFSAYVNSLSATEIFLNNAAAEILSHYIIEFRPQHGVLSAKTQENVRAHLVAAASDML